MDKRIHEINRLVMAYSQGRFNARLDVQPVNDDLNACMWNINILGEELESIAITRDYFNAIFDNIDEMVMIIGRNGTINDLNAAASEQLGYAKKYMVDQPFDKIGGTKGFQRLNHLRRQIPKTQVVRLAGQVFHTAAGVAIPVDLTIKFISEKPPQLSRGILLTAKNATDRINAENSVLRAVISALEQDRLRLARDLHDSVGQQLAATQFMVSAATKECQDPAGIKSLYSAKASLDAAQAEIRNVCFRLAPRTLAEQGLLPAVKELCDHIGEGSGTRFQLKCSPAFPSLQPALGTDLFRIIQEFTHNAIRHGAATQVYITLAADRRSVQLWLKDNGSGFDTSRPPGDGMGLSNMKTRVESHAGQFSLTSSPGNTHLVVTIPLKKELHIFNHPTCQPKKPHPFVSS